MKKLIFATAVVLSISGSAMAQQGARTPQNVPVEQRVEQTTSKLKETITLTDAQWKELGTIYTTYYNEMEASRKQSSGRPDRTKMTALKEERDEKIKALLGEDTFKKVLEAESKMRGSGSRGGRMNRQ